MLEILPNWIKKTLRLTTNGRKQLNDDDSQHFDSLG